MEYPQKIVLGLIGCILLSSVLYGAFSIVKNKNDDKNTQLGMSKGATAIEFLNYTMERLKREIDRRQNMYDVPGLPPLVWKKGKGLYGSDVRLNFHGSWEMAAIRNAFSVYDNNIFATSWITACLLESHLFGAGPKHSAEHINLAVQATKRFVDKNVKYNTSTMTFWPQVYNESVKHWQSTPENLLDLFSIVKKEPNKLIEKLLDILDLKQIEEIMKRLISEE